MLNACDEYLVLTEKQLHAVNVCPVPEDLEIPFLELRSTLENIEKVKVWHYHLIIFCTSYPE